jgi:putative membrane protein
VTAPEHSYKRLSPLTPLVRSFIFVVAVVGTSWDDLVRGDVGPVGWVLLGLLFAGALYGTASWLRTKYWIDGAELRVDTGVISRQSRRIRVDRLQGVDIVQPFVARIFGLAELKMDVAGGGSREGSLAFLRLQEAHALRETLLARRDAVREAGAAPGVTREAGPEPAHDAALAPERVIARLDAGMLLVSLLLSAETLGFVVSAVAFGVVFAVVGGFGGAAGILPVVLGFAVAQARKLSAFYGFTVAQSASGLQVRRGLLERSAQTIALTRVQGVVIAEPWLWRRLGWARLDVSVAGYGASGGDGGPSVSTVMPVAQRGSVVLLARHLLQGPDPDGLPLVGVPDRARWVAPVRRRGLSVAVGEHLVISREGRLTRRTHAVPHARVQSLRLSQGPWQRRLGLADLLVDSPPGPVKLRARHRDAAEARRLLETERVLAARHRNDRVG